MLHGRYERGRGRREERGSDKKTKGEDRRIKHGKKSRSRLAQPRFAERYKRRYKGKKRSDPSLQRSEGP
jgi:hypothetical protein